MTGAGQRPAPSLTWDQVLAWRMRRQWLTGTGAAGPVEVVRRLAGVQAQVPSAAATAVAVRQARPRPGEVGRLLAGGALVRTWAMRGTLHLLAPEDAGAYLSLLAAARTWEKGAWRRTFLDAADMDRLATAVAELLDGRVLSREDLVAGVVERTGDRDLADKVRSGWGTVLKPLAWQGLVCNGPGEGARVTFTRPDTWVPGWSGLPAVEEAAAVVVPAYLGAHGPAGPEAFDRWLTRGASRRASVREWFAQLEDRLTLVDVEGQPAYARGEDVDELGATVPDATVRLLPAFDQYLLGPGTGDVHVVAPRRRPLVSRTAGWISPVVVAGGRVAGTWNVSGDRLDVALFAEHGGVPADALAAEAERISSVTGARLAMSVTVG